MKMHNFASSSVSVYTISNPQNEDDYACDFEELFGSDIVTHNSVTNTLDNRRINIQSTMAPYDPNYEWDLENVVKLSEFFTALCDLYPEAYAGNIKNQETILANFVSLTRGLSTYLPEGILAQFQEAVEEALENDGTLMDVEEEITVYGTIFTKFTSEMLVNDELVEHIHSIVFSVFIEFEDIQFVINYNFNNDLEVVYTKDLGIIKISANPSAYMGKHVGKDYTTALLRAKLEGKVQLEEEAVTYVTAFNKEDYAPYNFIYSMNNLFVSVIENISSVYRSLKPINYFVISDIIVTLDSYAITVDNYAVTEFIQENQIDLDDSIVNEIEAFGNGLLRVLVTFDKLERDADNTFLEQSISDYTKLILDKYMGITLTGTSLSTLREYVEAHFYALCKLVGNPNNLKERMLLEIAEPPLVTMSHMIIRDIDEIPLWVYMIAIPCVLYLCNTSTDEELVELAEYDEKGIENHPKFMETVYMVKELLDKKWN